MLVKASIILDDQLIRSIDKAFSDWTKDGQELSIEVCETGLVD